MIAIIQVEEKSIQSIQIQCNVQNTLAQIFDKFLNKVFPGANENNKIDINDYIFFINGNEIKKEQKIKDLNLGGANENKIIMITIRKRSKVMKCPLCYCNNCIIRINNFGLYFSDCKYKHESIKIFADYEASQKNDFSKIKCIQCGKTQKEDLKDFYKCLNCRMPKCTYYLCDKHSNEHNKNRKEKDKHNLIKYDEKYYYCSNHFTKFISYCKTCNINLCEICEIEHKQKAHETIIFDLMKPKIENTKKELEEINNKITIIKEQIYNLDIILDKAVVILKNYYLISKDIIEKYESFNTKLINYQVIKTVNYLSYSNKSINKQLDNFFSENDWLKRCNILIDIYKSGSRINEGHFEVDKEEKSIMEKDEKPSEIKNLKIKKKINK